MWGRTVRVKVKGATLFVALSVFVYGFTAYQAGTAPAHAEAPPLTAPDVASAQINARNSGQRVEILSLETETTNVYANPDGTFTSEISAGPIRVAGANGWHPIDTSLVSDSSGVHPVATKAGLRFSPGGSGDAARLTSGRRSVGISLQGSSLPAPAISGSTATYANVVPGVDLQLQALSTGYQERLATIAKVLTRAPR